MRVERATILPGDYPADVDRVRVRSFPHWYLEGSHRGGLLYRAVEGGLVGYLIVQVEGSVAYVEELAVEPAFRGGGVARSLVARAAADLADRVEKWTVFPMSGRTAESRRAVFLALGFRPDPDHPNLLLASPHELCAGDGSPAGPQVTTAPAGICHPIELRDGSRTT
jgi:GNAT superfamily N-acetyltransferase